MKKKMRVMAEKPLNAETPIEYLRTWTTDNEVFFKRNQGQFMEKPVALSDWKLTLDGLVERRLVLTFEDIRFDACPKWKLPTPWSVPETADPCSKKRLRGTPGQSAALEMPSGVESG